MVSLRWASAHLLINKLRSPTAGSRLCIPSANVLDNEYWHTIHCQAHLPKLFFQLVRIGVWQGAVGIGRLGFATGFVEFDETADGPLCLRVPVAQGGLQPGVAGQQQFFGLAVAPEFNQARGEVTPTSIDQPVVRLE